MFPVDLPEILKVRLNIMKGYKVRIRNIIMFFLIRYQQNL